MNHGRKIWGVLLLATASVGGLTQHAQARRLCTSAQHFVGYFRQLEKAGLWERIALSLVLTGTESDEPACSQESARRS